MKQVTFLHGVREITPTEKVLTCIILESNQECGNGLLIELSM
jgi:hypothetical protein